MDNTIYVVNNSTLVTDQDVATMTAAIAKQVVQHACPAHGLAPVPVLYAPRDHPPARQARVVAVADESGQDGALGFHTQDPGEHIWGLSAAKTVLDQGAHVLTGPYAVSTILSHEVLEMLVNPYCVGFADTMRGYLIAREIGDPVQSDHYDIDGVTVSNFAHGEWFNPMAARGAQFDQLGNLRRPFSMTKGGYLVEMRGGQSKEVFGEAMPEWLRAMKRTATSRTQRIKAGQPSAAA